MLEIPLRAGTRCLSRVSRSFSSSASKSQLELVHQVWKPQADRPPLVSSGCKPIIFMHGLFGSKQNNRSISKLLASQLNTDIFTIDLRNHGDSPHSDHHNYASMADDVEAFIHKFELDKPVLMGHSMGAKTAMTVALRSPDLVSSVIAVDNGPVRASLGSEFAKYIEGMKEIERAGVTKQAEADSILQRYEESLPIRQFLLTNLVRPKGENTLKWRVPVSTLGEALSNMADFPYGESDELKYTGPSLFIRGTRSNYVRDKSLPLIKQFFPNSQIRDVEAGHWVTSENPEGFRKGTKT
ncbi:hypothetical protein AJ80_07322 [Polytolypa hystricis UAMH7299]|uniref:AB hydrolase-1 domain-containing protein n=1 Tax=Polytolypa hystricis (strain UAMH7299) TaxID=1447883 RepID=A0A2B7XPS8_POLH7|nr:hypothetical protein AJ80_07322 [Polytolypa hystricis UAMH7299]